MLVSMNSKCKNSILKMALGIAILLFIVIIDNKKVFASTDFLYEVGYGSMGSVTDSTIKVQNISHTNTQYTESSNYDTYFPNTSSINNQNVFGVFLPTVALTNGSVFTVNINQNTSYGYLRPYYALANMSSGRTTLDRSQYYGYLNQVNNSNNNVLNTQFRGIKFYSYCNNTNNECYITGIVLDDTYIHEYEYLYIATYFSNAPTTENGAVVYINTNVSSNSGSSTDLSTLIKKIDNLYTLLDKISSNTMNIFLQSQSITSALSFISEQLDTIYSLNTLTSNILSQLSKLDNLNNVLGSPDQDPEVDPEVNDDIQSIENGYQNSSSGLNQGINNMNNSQAEIDDIQNNYINNAANGYDSIGDYVYFTEGGLFSALSFISMQLTSIYNLMSSFKIVLTIGMVCGLFIALIGVLKVYRR